MKRFGLLQVMLLVALVVLTAQAKTISAAADPWPPFVDPDNSTQGLSLEIIRAALATQGYEVTMKFMPWNRALIMVQTGKVDILPDAWMSAERQKDLLFSEPYAANELKFIKRQGDPFEYSGLASLDDKTVGTILGYAYSDAFQKSRNFRRLESYDLITNVRHLLDGTLDLTVEDQIVATSRLKKADPNLLASIEFSKNALSVNKMYVAVGKTNPRAQDIIDAFNQGLAVIKANGSLAKILKPYVQP